MLREILKSKIHRATVTDANLSYEGSITIDPELMALSDIEEYEKVQVVDLNNGERFETYCIRGQNPGSGEICVNGAASRLVQIGDLVIIMAFTWLEDDARRTFSPKVVKVTPENRPKE
ncbi:MAG TPA: aspartate 1-decarboxylase [Fibrobacteria bacterium]|jgi:aspartate 1-decarboxylase|nr:aspartate 1-decarboxylase [Fibrobacteria bacterium]